MGQAVQFLGSKAQRLLQGFRSLRTGKPQPAPKKVSFYLPILELAYDVFGEDRLVYGSDWPVTETTGDYESVLKLTRSWAVTKGDSFELKLFYKNAVRFYGIPKILRETIPSTIPKK